AALPLTRSRDRRRSSHARWGRDRDGRGRPSPRRRDRARPVGGGGPRGVRCPGARGRAAPGPAGRAAAGTGSNGGMYQLGDVEVAVEDGAAPMREGGTLAGSVLTMSEGVRNIHAARV